MYHWFQRYWLLTKRMVCLVLDQTRFCEMVRLVVFVASFAEGTRSAFRAFRGFVVDVSRNFVNSF